jgi:hypothetical protein
MQNPKPPSLLYLSAVAAIRCGTFLSPNDLTGNSSHLGYMHSLPQTCFRPTWPLFQNIPIQSKLWTRLAKQLESQFLLVTLCAAGLLGLRIGSPSVFQCTQPFLLSRCYASPFRGPQINPICCGRGTPPALSTLNAFHTQEAPGTHFPSVNAP